MPEFFQIRLPRSADFLLVGTHQKLFAQLVGAGKLVEEVVLEEEARLVGTIPIGREQIGKIEATGIIQVFRRNVVQQVAATLQALEGRVFRHAGNRTRGEPIVAGQHPGCTVHFERLVATGNT